MHNSFFSNQQKKYLRTRSEKGRGALSSTPSPACPSLSWALTPRQTPPTYLLFICFSAFVFLDFFYTGFSRVRHLLLIGFSLKQILYLENVNKICSFRCLSEGPFQLHFPFSLLNHFSKTTFLLREAPF